MIFDCDRLICPLILKPGFFDLWGGERFCYRMLQRRLQRHKPYLSHKIFGTAPTEASFCHLTIQVFFKINTRLRVLTNPIRQRLDCLNIDIKKLQNPAGFPTSNKTSVDLLGDSGLIMDTKTENRPRRFQTAHKSGQLVQLARCSGTVDFSRAHLEVGYI